jgi:hypothetical protein
MWETPQFSRTQVNRAGDALRDPNAPVANTEHAVTVINNWRAAHRYPLNTIQMLLRKRAGTVDYRATVAQRLKRLPSVKSKLERFPTMTVTQIQDVGGCRGVVSSVHAVRRLQRIFEQYPVSNELVDCDDYISTPQADGYRSVHLVYRYFNTARPWYDKLLIEVQLRSQLQHVWATAVETVDTFEHEALKLKRGDPTWERFFALMATALAIKENSPPVRGTPEARTVLRAELRDLARRLEVRKKLMSYRSMLRVFRQPGLREADLFLMDLRPEPGVDEYRLQISGYPKSEGEKATEDYSKAEVRTKDLPGSHVVLVTVQSLQKLPRAYPNYFLDTGRFLKLMTEAMS